MPGSLIILGASARAAAQSAQRADFNPWCIDLFNDRDLRAIAPTRRCPANEYPGGMLRLLEEAPPEAPLLLTGAMENYPELLKAAAFEHPLIGSSIDAMQAVRDPLALPSLPTVTGLKFCKTKTAGSFTHRLGHLVFGMATRRKYVLKPRRSAGGVGIEWWHPGMRVGKQRYIQQYIRGQPYSAVFHADGWSASLMGVTEQLVGEPDFGAAAFRYCGSLGPVHLSSKARNALSHLAVQLTQRYDVRGIFGVDLVMDWRGNLWPIEVNPRYVSSIEILERAFRLPLLTRIGGSAVNSHGRRAIQWHGKAIVFARQKTQLGDLYEQFGSHQIADVPDPGQVVGPGKPICTVFATGHNRDDCYKQLAKMAQQIYHAHRPGAGTATDQPT